MSRECRRVSANWQHPKDSSGRYIPLHDRDFEAELVEWLEEKGQWARGLRQIYAPVGWIPRKPEDGESYEKWNGECPCQDDYMPNWPDDIRTHYQMYETTSEGTPISPVMASPEELAHWLADNGASAFAGMTATYEQWLRTIVGSGSIGSCVKTENKIISGVETVLGAQVEQGRKG